MFEPLKITVLVSLTNHFFQCAILKKREMKLTVTELLHLNAFLGCTCIFIVDIFAAKPLKQHLLIIIVSVIVYV